jgi:ATP-dependent RNA helicase DDX46/PRP5
MQSQIKAMEDEAARQDETSAEYRKATNVIEGTVQSGQTDGGHRLVDDASAARKKDPSATDYHAIIPINDLPQKVRWKVTNEETMSQVSPFTLDSVIY